MQIGFPCASLQIPAEEPLMSAGLDSLAAVELRNSLQSKFGVDLPATVTFDHPSIAALAVHIAGLVSEQQGAGEATDSSALSLGSSSLGMGSLISELQGIVAGMLGTEVASDQPLMEAGLDSLAAVELRNELGNRFGLDMPATAMFDYPTISAMAAFISENTRSHVDGSQALGTSLPLATPAPSNEQQELLTSLVGLSSRFPAAEAGNVAAFWQGALQAADLQEQVPFTRWDLDRVYSPDQASGKLYARFAAFVQGVECFDAQVRILRVGSGQAQLSDTFRAVTRPAPFAAGLQPF